MKHLLALAITSIVTVVSYAQQTLPRVDANTRVKMDPAVVALAKPKDDLAAQISTTETTEIFGYVSFTDPVTKAKTLPTAANGQYSGHASIRAVFKSKKDQRVFIKYGGNIDMSFAFVHVDHYLKYDLLVKPDKTTSIDPFINSRSLVYNTLNWELYSYQLVWVFGGDSKSKIGWDPAAFPDKILSEKNQDFGVEGTVWYLPLNKLNGVDESLPKMD